MNYWPKIKGNSINDSGFWKHVHSLRCVYCDYSPRAPDSLATALSLTDVHSICFWQTVHKVDIRWRVRLPFIIYFTDIKLWWKRTTIKRKIWCSQITILRYVTSYVLTKLHDRGSHITGLCICTKRASFATGHLSMSRSKSKLEKLQFRNFTNDTLTKYYNNEFQRVSEVE